jgi:hypothetical protein
MANAVYNEGRNGHLDGSIDWDTAVFKVALVRGYTFAASHKFVSDVTGGGGGTIAATSAALASKTVGTVAAGVADAADITFTAPTANASQHVLILFQSSAVTGGADVAATAQRLVAYYDTGTNLPIPSLNGGDVTVAFNASGIYSI